MHYPRQWFHGRTGNLGDAIDRYGALYLTDDWDFASGYGDVYEITLTEGLRVLDTTDKAAVAVLLKALRRDRDRDLLPPALDDTAENLSQEDVSPDHIRSESVYDDADFQRWLFEHGYDLVTFWDEDTALLLNASEGVDSYSLVEE